MTILFKYLTGEGKIIFFGSFTKVQPHIGSFDHAKEGIPIKIDIQPGLKARAFSKESDHYYMSIEVDAPMTFQIKIKFASPF